MHYYVAKFVHNMLYHQLSELEFELTIQKILFANVQKSETRKIESTCVSCLKIFISIRVSVFIIPVHICSISFSLKSLRKNVHTRILGIFELVISRDFLPLSLRIAEISSQLKELSETRLFILCDDFRELNIVKNLTYRWEYKAYIKGSTQGERIEKI